MVWLTKPEKRAMQHPNVLGAWAKKRKWLTPKSKKKVVMAEYKRWTLHSWSWSIVRNPKQAVAIAYSEAKK